MYELAMLVVLASICSLRDSLAASFFFFFKDTAPPEIYPLSLHDALPILGDAVAERHVPPRAVPAPDGQGRRDGDLGSCRLGNRDRPRSPRREVDGQGVGPEARGL